MISDSIPAKVAAVNSETFKRLLARGERQTCDFKIECHAFESKTKEPKAELLKDICALANNRKESYLIVGVSTDGKSFKNVTNDKLTDDNLQTLCRHYLSPHPNVRLEAKVFPEYPGVRFVVIRVGPSKSKTDVFRFAQHFIDHKEGKGFAFKKNEVWIRNNATSDLATPEEIGRLLKGQNPVDESQASVPDVIYSELSSKKILKAIQDDVSGVVSASKGTHEAWDADPMGPWRVVLPIQGMNVAFGLKLTRALQRKGAVWEHVNGFGVKNHGSLIVSDGNVSPTALAEPPARKFKKPWGHFLVYETPWRWMRLPYNTSDFKTFSVVIPKAESRHKLQSALNDAIAFLSSDPECKEILEEVICSQDDNAHEWIKNGRYAHEVNLRPPSKKRPKDLRSDQAWVPNTHGEYGSIYHVDRRDTATLKELIALNPEL